MSELYLIKRLSGIYFATYQNGVTGTKIDGVCFSARTQTNFSGQVVTDEILFLEYSDIEQTYVRYYRICNVDNLTYARDNILLSKNVISQLARLEVYHAINTGKLMYHDCILVNKSQRYV